MYLNSLVQVTLCYPSERVRNLFLYQPPVRSTCGFCSVFMSSQHSIHDITIFIAHLRARGSLYHEYCYGRGLVWGRYIHIWPSLVPRPPPFFVLRFAFSIIHGSGRARKTGKAWFHLSRA